MAKKKKKKDKITERDLAGFKYFKKLSRMLAGLHSVACERDKAHQRLLHMDEYMTLLLLTMFSPICTSLRAMQQASELKKVQRKLRVPRASLGSLSEAARIFDSDLLLELIGQLADQVAPQAPHAQLNDLGQILTLVDGTLLTSLPKTVEALWLDETHRAFKTHVHYELLKAVPIKATLTDANHSEKAVLRQELEADRLYVLDRGYAGFDLLQAIIEAQSSFVCRLPQSYCWTTLQESVLTPEAVEAGVLRDQWVELGEGKARKKLKQPLRVIQLKCTERTLKSVRQMREKNKKEIVMIVVTNRTDLPAEVIALIYRYRWQIEIFFRYFKHMLGCRHLLSYCDNGVELQTYAGIIACLLIALYSGRKPTRRTFEMFCWFMSGWADEEELLAHIHKLSQHA